MLRQLVQSAAHLFGILLLTATSTFVCGAENPPSKKPTAAALRNWVTQLGSPNFETREVALDALIEAGRPSIAPLAEAVMSSDPEVAWRAATALEAIGLTGDEATLGEIKTRMEKTKGTPHRDLAMVLGTLSQRWIDMQRVKAQTELVKLGATFPNAASAGGFPSPYGGGPVFLGSYAAAPTFSSGTVVIESFSSTIPIIPTPARVVEFDPLTLPSSLERIVKDLEDTKETLEKAVEESKEGEVKIEDLKELVDKARIKLSSTVRGEAEKREDGKASDEKKAASDAKAETKPEKPSAPDEKAEKEKPAEKPKSDGEAERAEPPTVVLTESVAEDARAIAVDYSFISPTMAGTALAEPTLYAGGGVIRLDKEWRGGDRGLVHLAGLAHVNMLDIHDAAISDKAIEYFKKMPSLNSIMIRGTKMTPEALMKLVKEKPGLQIRGQSRGILGINAGDTDGPSLVSGVPEGKPAAAAGILPGDLITKLDGKEITTFGHMTLLMMKREPGEEVTLTIKRGEEILEKKLKLATREPITP